MATKVPKIILEDFGDMLDFEPKDPAVTPAPAQGGIAEMDFDRMTPFPGHKFKLYEGQRLDNMVESIRQFGILLPIILWHTDDDRHVILIAADVAPKKPKGNPAFKLPFGKSKGEF